MSQLNITCPHCGFSKNIDQQRIPPGVKTIKCPKCQQSFAFEPNQETASSIELAEIQPRQELPPASSQAQTTNGGGDGEYSKPFRFCSSCGQKIQLDAENCPKCGARRAPSSNAVSKVGLLLITFFFGGLGGTGSTKRNTCSGCCIFCFSGHTSRPLSPSSNSSFTQPRAKPNCSKNTPNQAMVRLWLSPWCFSALLS